MLSQSDRNYVEVIKRELFTYEFEVKERKVQIEAVMCNGEQLELYRVLGASPCGELLKAIKEGVFIHVGTPVTTLERAGRYMLVAINTSGHSFFNTRQLGVPVNG